MKAQDPLTITISDSFPLASAARLRFATAGCSCWVSPLGDASVSCSAYRSRTFGRMTGQFTKKRGY